MAKRFILDAELGRELVRLKDEIVQRDTDWAVIGLLTESTDLIENHPRLLRSQYFQDDDYPQSVTAVLLLIAERDLSNIERIKQLFEMEGTSSVGQQRISITPRVFEIPAASVDPNLVSAMMPFDAAMIPVYEAIKDAVADVQGASLTCQRVDDIWIHSNVIQDVFSLIYRSSIVVCDFTKRNPNVLYEAGIAHTLGRHVVPITQSEDDIPFDLRAHRFLLYLNNEEGRAALRAKLTARLKTLVGQP